MPNDMRDRLIELLAEGLEKCIDLECNKCQYEKSLFCRFEMQADYLIANGVILPEKRYKCPKCGHILTPRADDKYYFCFNCMNEFTQEDAEKALREREGE